MVVPDYQLSLAIGKEGQNARLAARLTGYKIDIKSETQAKDAPGFRYEGLSDDFDDEEYEEDYDGYEESYEEAPADGEMLPDEEMSDGKENFPEEDMIRKRKFRKTEMLRQRKTPDRSDRFRRNAGKAWCWMNKKVPLRQCIGCGQMKGKKEMMRILRTTRVKSFWI